MCAEGLGEGFGGECGCAGDGGYEWVCFWGVSGEGGGGFGGGVGGGGGGGGGGFEGKVEGGWVGGLEEGGRGVVGEEGGWAWGGEGRGVVGICGRCVCDTLCCEGSFDGHLFLKLMEIRQTPAC